MAVSLELLTDEDILDYSRSDGQERVLTEYRDINLNFGKIETIQKNTGMEFDKILTNYRNHRIIGDFKFRIFQFRTFQFRT